MIKVYKIGGNVVEDEKALKAFCKEFAALQGPKVLIHGGGVMASKMQEALGQKPLKIEGRRVTDEAALKVVTMTYAGWCNKHICALLQACGCNALGLSGCDGSVIKAAIRPPRVLEDGVTVVDYGFVGDVMPSSVNAALLKSFLQMGLTPVLSAINHDGKGRLLNTNADTMASCVAASLGASLVCCFELPGVMLDPDEPSSVLPTVNLSEYSRLKACGVIRDGMIPKIENCLSALRNGAESAEIRSAKGLDTDSGTKIMI